MPANGPPRILVCAHEMNALADIRRLLTAGGRLDFPIYLNVYDIILFAARKPDGSTGAAGAPR